MKLFEFLETISKEKFPFKLEYEEWNGNVKVIVDTFSRIEQYLFNENGVIEHTEYNEVKTIVDKEEIESKIIDLINRPEKAWIEASQDLGISFIHPYRFTGLNGEKYQITGLLPDFGSGKGVLITDRKSDEESVLMADLTNDYFTTGLSPRYYDIYDRDLFIETLSEWGWIGKGEKPNWIKINDR